MKRGRRRIVIAALFAGLVVALLWFQGILFRPAHPVDRVPEPARASLDARRAKVETRDLPRVTELPGFVEPIDPAEIAPRVVATITAVTQREGDEVVEGARLVTLEDRDARARLDQARGALEAARVAVEQSRLAYERAAPLHERNALSTQDWEAARAAFDTATANEARARAALAEAENAASWYHLDAPFAGRVLSRTGEPGQLAMPGRTVITLYRPDRLRFAVGVPDDKAADLRVGGRHEIEFDGLPTRTAELTRIVPTSDPRTGTVTLHLELTEVAGLRPGQMGRLRLVDGRRTARLVPSNAVHAIGQLERVMVVRDGRAVPVLVRTGKVADGFTEIQSGLDEGEEVLLP